MSVDDMMITLPSGEKISFAQANALVSLLTEMGEENCHWHFNDCRCCVTIHGSDRAYLINRDGDATMYPGRGCSCEH